MEIRELLAQRAALVAEAERILADYTDKDGKISVVYADKFTKTGREHCAFSENRTLQRRIIETVR